MNIKHAKDDQTSDLHVCSIEESDCTHLEGLDLAAKGEVAVYLRQQLGRKLQLPFNGLCQKIWVGSSCCWWWVII